MKAYISVCKNTILSNIKNKRNDPPIRVAVGSKHAKPERMHRAEFGELKGLSVIYDPKHPMPWGARVWLEVEW